MSQSDILTILYNNQDRWFSSEELSNMLNIRPGTISVNVDKLRNRHVVKHKYYNKRAYVKYLENKEE